jgi:hypothetical protein
MSHFATRHHVPVQVEDVLERCAGVRREAEAADAGVACDARGGEHKSAREVGVGEIGH